MNKKKGRAAVLFCSFSLLLLCIRQQRVLPTVLLFAFIVANTVLYRDPTGLVLITGGLLFLYPGPHAGWLWGFDSHSPARLAKEFTRSQWPQSDVLVSFGDPSTPLLHAHVALVYRVTGLPIIPNVEPSLLSSALLPLVYVGAGISIIAVPARRFSVRNRTPTVIALLPVTLWMPMYAQKTALRRHSLSVVLFGLLVAGMYLYHETGRTTYLNIVIVAGVLTPMAHILSSVFVILTLTIATAFYLNSGDTVSQPARIAPFAGLLLLVGLTSVSWFFFQQRSGRFVIGALFNIYQTLTSYATPGNPVAVESDISYSLYRIVRTHLAKWIYAGLVGTAITVSTLLDRDSFWERFVFGYGCIIGVSAVVAWFVPSLDPYRMMTFLMMLGGWVAGVGAWKSTSLKPVPNGTATVFVLILAVLAAATVPIHAVSTEPPEYNDGVYNERFSPQVYAVSDFVGSNVDGAVVGDVAVAEVVIPIDQTSVILKPPGDSRRPIVLADWNREIYTYRSGFGKFGFLDLSDSWASTTEGRNSIYTNGEYSVYDSAAAS